MSFVVVFSEKLTVMVMVMMIMVMGIYGGRFGVATRSRYPLFFSSSIRMMSE